MGVEPKPKATVVEAPSKPESSQNGSSPKEPPRSVQDIDEEAEMEMESEDEYQRREPSEDEGRYGIAARNQEPRKRRKIATSQEVHAVFTTDDEDEYEENASGLIISTVTGKKSSDAEDDEYASGGDAKSRMARRRSYWLSKGIGTGETHDDSS